MGQRRKILISAYACNPYRGSEEGVGWGWVNAIAKYHDLWVITADFHSQDIEREIRKHSKGFQNVSFHYVPPKPWHYAPTKRWRFIEESLLKPIMNLAYRKWQKDALRIGERLHNQIRFDLVHLLTYVGFRFPGHLWKLDTPFVWGPIGGLENTPWRFLPSLGLSGCVYYAFRNIANSLDKRFLPGPKLAFRKAHGAAIAATGGIQNEIRRWYGEESVIASEVGPPLYIAANHSIRSTKEPLKLTWSGLHLPGKALPLLLGALHKLDGSVDISLDILGHGPCTKKWKRMADMLNLGEKCKWHGWLPRNEAIALVHEAHAFIITSIKDLTSTVLLEALSQGVPVICLDHCGFADVVTDACGIKVPVSTPRQVESDLATAINKLNSDEKERQRLAKGALRRIRDFSWEKKAHLVNSIYQRAMENKTMH
jgi:glycosyltransferase involved in cell wall biosynthesis